MKIKTLIENNLKKLKREDLVNQIKVFKTNRLAYYFHTCVFGCIFGYPTIKGPVLDSKNIFIFGHFNYFSKQAKKKTILHELAHIIDYTQDNDISIHNGGHGQSFTEIMNKLGYDKIGIDYSEYLSDIPNLNKPESDMIFDRELRGV